MEFNDRFGTPVAYLDETGVICRFEGMPLAYVHGQTVYSFNGTHLGWFLDGWILDRNGYVAFFSSESSEVGLAKPYRKTAPKKGTKRPLPLKETRHIAGAKPHIKALWSPLSGMLFFEQR